MAHSAFLNGLPASADALRALALTNYGHFTSMQVRGGTVQGLELHLRRLWEASAELFDAELDEARLRGWMRQAAAGGDCSLRVTVFARDFDYRQPLRTLVPDVLVTTAPPSPPRTQALQVCSRAFVRPAPHLKHVGTFPLFHYRRLARQAGFDDALFVDGTGPQARVVEGTVWNIGFWDGAEVVWPQAPALRGTAEQLLQAGLAEAGLPPRTRPVALSEVAGFRAAFAANANGLQPIAGIDAVRYPDSDELVGRLALVLAARPWQAI